MKRLAFAIFGASTTVVIVSIVLLAMSLGARATGFGYRGWSITFALTFVIVGLVIASHRPDNAIGWVLSVIGFGASLLALADELGFYGIAHPHPLGAWGAWLAEWLWAPLLAGIFVVVPLIFPEGRLLSQRWRSVIVLVVVASALGSFWLAFAPGTLDQSTQYVNPVGIAFAGEPIVVVLSNLGLSALMLSMALGAVSTVIRFRRSAGIERQQIKWLAFSVAVAAGAFMTYLPWGITGGTPPKYLEVVMTSLILTVPICIGIAVMRYRLYDIDRIINRTLSYVIISVLLGGMFALVALLPTALLGAGERPDWVIALATLVVAGLFRPVRGRVQQAVDHRFNRRRYDAERTVNAFAARLREQIDIDALRAEVCAVVNTTMQPARVSVWLAGKP